MIFRRQKLLRYDDMIFTFMSKGFYLRHIHVSIQINTLRFLRKYNRNVKMLGSHAGNADPGRLDSKYFIDGFSFKAALELRSHLIQKLNIHLMVQETIYFEYIPLFYNSVFYNTFF